MPCRVILFIAFLLLPGVAHAQSAAPELGQRPVAPASVHAPGDHEELLDVRYDRAKDMTSLRAGIINLLPGLDLSFSTAHPGPVASALPDSVTIFITAIGDYAKLKRARHLELMLDGRTRLLVQNMQVHERKLSGITVVQAVGAIPSALFLRMANAEEVAGTYGEVRFYIGPVHMEHLRDLVKHMVPQGSLWSETQRSP